MYLSQDMNYLLLLYFEYNEKSDKKNMNEKIEQHNKSITEAFISDDLNKFKSIEESIPNIDDAIFSITTPMKSGSRLSDSCNKSLPSSGLRLIHIAAFYNALDCLRYLQLTRKVSLQAKSTRSFHPIHYSCYSGSAEVTLYILTQEPTEVKYYIADSGYVQLIYCAINGQSPEILTALFQKGILLGRDDAEAKSNMFKAIELHDSDILKIIYKNSKHNTTKSKISTLPLSMLAIEEHNFEAFKLLYNGKEDIIYKSPDGTYKNLICLICQNDRFNKLNDVLLSIIDDGKEIDLEPPKNFKQGLVHFACQYMNFDVAKKIFRLPYVDLNRLDSNGKLGPAYLTVSSSQDKYRDVKFEILKMIFHFNFNPNLMEPGKPSLLETFVLACFNDLQMIECLLANGADTNLIIQRGQFKGKSLYDYVMGLEKKLSEKLDNNQTQKRLIELFKRYHKKYL